MITNYDIAKQYFDDNKDNITPQSLADYLALKEVTIYSNYDKKCKRTDIMLELEEREIEHTKDDIDNILDIYEDYLEDNDAWRDCLNEAIYDVMGE